MAQGEPTELQRPKNAVVQEVEASEAGSDRQLGYLHLLTARHSTVSRALARQLRRAGRAVLEHTRSYGE